MRASRNLRRLAGSDGINAIRRHMAMRLDQGWALAWNRFAPALSVPYDGKPRLALISVNFSTTYYLKLMLLTLSEQNRLGLVNRIILVDNNSRDGGQKFLHRLAERVPRLHIVANRHFVNHARGMRAGVRALDRVEINDLQPSNTLLFCDTDVIFRNPDALNALVTSASVHDAAFIGEMRIDRSGSPNIQASFFAVRRDVYARREIAPLVNHGSPALWQQESVRRAGLALIDFPSNHGGYILHRGRTGVAAASEFLPHHPYATADRRSPHFMGVPNGREIWAAIEQRQSSFLPVDSEQRLIEILAERFTVLGTP